jgi:putative Holliday junction resolvase
MTDKSRILGIDLGKKRVGLAISDPGGTIALGLETIENTGQKALIEALRDIVSERGVARVVLGLPLNMDASRGPGARDAEAFAARLREAIGPPVVLWDERLSTIAAERALECGNISQRKKKRHVDRMAAQLILQAYLDHLPAEPEIYTPRVQGARKVENEDTPA